MTGSDGTGGLDAQQSRLFAASRYAAVTCQRHPEVLGELRDSGDLERAYPDDHLTRSLAARLEGVEDGDSLNRELRRFRRREMLRILWRDFNRLAPTLETTRDTSLLAEASITLALDFWHAELVAEHGEPKNARGESQQLVVLAMGKLGTST